MEKEYLELKQKDRNQRDIPRALNNPQEATINTYFQEENLIEEFKNDWTGLELLTEEQRLGSYI